MKRRAAHAGLLLAGVFLVCGPRDSAAQQATPPASVVAIRASPNPVPAGAGPGSTTISWTTGYDDAEVRVSIDGAPDRVVARGKSGSTVVDWIQTGPEYEFRLYTVGNSALLLDRVKVSRAKPANPPPAAVIRTPAAIDANPKVLAAGSGPGSTTITWSTGDGSDGEVRVSIDRAAEQLFARGKTGKLAADWIQGGATYDFNLYATNGPATRLATVRVTRAAPPPGIARIDANPNPVPAGPGRGETTITWTTGDGSDGQIRVSLDGGLERLVGRGGSGSLRANWIDSSSRYEFRLYTSAQPARLLGAVTVSRAVGSMPITPPSVDLSQVEVPGQPGKTQVRVTWTTGDRSDGSVYVSTDGGPEEVFLQGPTGSAVAEWIRETSSYEFRLYSVGSRTLLATAKLPAKSASPSPAKSDEPLSATALASIRSRSFLSASPNPVPAGFGLGATQLSWSLDVLGHGIVMVSVDGGAETEVASGLGGTTTVSSIRAGSHHEFRLYGGQPRELILTTIVTRKSATLWLVAGSIVTLILVLGTIAWVRASYSPARKRG